ncbi:nuclear transport factor 2 family protein [Terrimonas pollutisoli]|uniref:nuclear transport factor 2 family protein n=1 Tax=Terrimonas pollutisoli TaxID=3034147 RepID=UPI0023EB27A8|nr:nuclear transport factor 2 family protein [Terrimonas sp. H1YJ31]
MKSTNIKICVLAILSLMLSVASIAQDKTVEEAAVRACLENYMSGDGNRMEKAFHPSATMKYIDAKTNEFKDVPIADFIARVKANTNKSERKIEIVALNIEGNAANGKIRIESGDVILYDYMNMLKIDGEWKIVSKIFSKMSK